MEMRPFFALLGLLATTAVTADVWRWVDENGVVHFSDTPREGAERVDISEATQTTGARVYRDRDIRPATEDAAEQPAEEPFRYESLAVASPGAEETLWNIEGVLNVSLALSPGLQDGHQVRVYHNGEQRLTTRSTSFTIDEVWRGVHNIQAEVIDETGKLMIRSQPNRFYVQQNTVIGGRR